MNLNKVNIRVYKRMPEGTILIWNTHPLTPEQRSNLKVSLCREDGSWIAPEVSIPDKTKMTKVLDGQTDTIMVKHAGDITEETPFTIKLRFGTTDIKEESLDVEARGRHTGYFKVMRWKLPNGRVVYGVPAVIVGDARDTLNRDPKGS